MFPILRTFTKGDAFVGYHEDTIPAVVLSVCSNLREDGTDLDDGRREEWEDKVSDELLTLLPSFCFHFHTNLNFSLLSVLPCHLYLSSVFFSFASLSAFLLMASLSLLGS